MKIGLQAWGSEGDIRPFTALAAGLVSAGHEVSLIVTDVDGRDYSSLAQRYRFALHSVPLPARAAEVTAAIWQAILAEDDPLEQAEMIMANNLDPAVEDMYAAALDLCVGKDVVIGHFLVFPLRVAAAKTGVPMASVNIGHNCLPSAHTCPPGLPDFGAKYYAYGWSQLRRMINRVFLRRVNALQGREGLPPDTDVMEQTWAAERLNMIAVSRHFCEPKIDWSPRHQVCGFFHLPQEDAASDPMPEGLDAFLAAGPPPVYMTFGSMMPRNLQDMRETVSLWTRAAAQAGCRAIVQIPWDDLTLFEADSGIFKVKRSPYRSVFPRCAAIVHHGGAGTTQTSLLAGKPSVVVAHITDQLFWGAELNRLGVAGNTLWRNSLTAPMLASEISLVLARAEMTQQAMAIGRSIAMENGVRDAVSMVEKNFGKGIEA